MIENTGKVIILVQLGTPEKLNRRSVARFIRRFLLDPRVIEIPALFRVPLVSLLIVPLRTGKALSRYRQIWDPEHGSPLKYHTSELVKKMNLISGSSHPILETYQYCSPRLRSRLKALKIERINQLVIVPLYPQPATSTTGSVTNLVSKDLAKWSSKPSVQWISPLWNRPGFLELLARKIEASKPKEYDRVLFSYHGLPLKQARLGYSSVCEEMTLRLTKLLGLSYEKTRMAYQSRFGRGWTRPLTNEVVDRMLSEGVRSLLVAAPSFVAECLETSWEIGIELKHQFLSQGGQSFEWVRSFNSDSDWAEWLLRTASSEL